MMDKELTVEKEAQKRFDKIVTNIAEAAQKRVLRVKTPKKYYHLFFLMDNPDKLLGN